MSGEWVTYNAADEGDDRDCFVVAVAKSGAQSYLPAHCEKCGCSTMASGSDRDGWECERCGKSVDFEDLKFPRTQAELWKEVASALFPAVCSFCNTEMIHTYAKIGAIDCGGYGNCERRPEVQ
jgi:ribosomal protein S27AE